ncbi:MAG: hypothetical protein KIT84_11710 [Labilithrix sp.]|nr:hypothetical protein [Labilithrix sp.]MCW5811676.1 hypothetical protein [Labilithrix sp.]
MTRLLLLFVLAAFAFACEMPSVNVKAKRDRSVGTDESEVREDDDEDDASDEDDDVVETDVSPTDTTPDPTPPPAPKDVFEGAPAFAGNRPGTESSDHHLGSSNAGKSCMSCHAPGKGAPTFVFGGTVQRSRTNTQGAAGVEVRVIDDKGAEIALATTDSSGNFWFKGAAQIPGGSRVAIRDAAGVQKMNGAIATGACNSGGCHTKELPIFLAP